MFWTFAASEMVAGTALKEDPLCGVSIGCYWHVPLVELQIRTIRHTCGPVPILISDDLSPDGRSERMREICSKYPNVDFISSESRIGHSGGDMAAFSRGVIWAKKRGLHAIAKISNRWLCVAPRWLQEGCKAMLEAHAAISSDSCVEGPNVFPLRTEAALLDVDAWHRPDALEYLHGRPTRAACEHIIWHAVKLWFGGRMHPWKALNGPNRMRRAPGVLWHTNTPLEEYRQLGEKMGVDLGPEFNTHGSHLIPGYQIG